MLRSKQPRGKKKKGTRTIDLKVRKAEVGVIMRDEHTGTDSLP